MKEPWEYYVVPAEVVSKAVREAHKIWLDTPGKKGQKHNDSSVRLFLSKPDKFSPKWYTQELINSFKNNINTIEK